MVGLGIDVSTKRIAIAALPEPGTEFPFGVRVKYDVLELERGYGAQLRSRARWATQDYIGRMFPGAAVALVEIARPGYTLMALSASVAEAVCTATHRGAIVLEEQPATWKVNSIGKGNARKPEIMEWVRDTYGYDGDDQDVADAVAMAHAGWVLWGKRMRSAA